MGDRYAVGLLQTGVSSTTTGADACGSIEAVTSVRPRIYDLIFSFRKSAKISPLHF